MNHFRDNDYPEFRERLKKLLKENGLTVDRFCENADISKSTYKTWVNNRTYKFPSMEYLLKIADYFHVSLDYLMCRNECTQVDNQQIHDKIGLSDKSIITLKELLEDRNKNIKECGSPLLNDYVEAINMLLEHPFGLGVLHWIGAYLKSDYQGIIYPSETEPLIRPFIEIGDDKGILFLTGGGETVLFNADMIDTALIEKIKACLSELRKEGVTHGTETTIQGKRKRKHYKA